MSDPLPGLEESQTSRRQPAPWGVAFVVLLVTLGSFALIGPLIGYVFGYVYYGDFSLGFFEFITLTADPIGHQDLKMPLMIIQGCATLFGLAIFPPLYWKTIRRTTIGSLFEGPKVKPIHLVMILGIVIFFMGFNSLLIEWNSKMDLPNGRFEDWAKDVEQKLGEFSIYLTSFNSFGAYLVGLLVIAVLPAIGEEMVFRGLVQPELHKATKNIHFAIWTSAIFFSALHLQFYGFFPRVFLGALFGYLYYWSGSLVVAMFAHFVNNAFAVTVLYLGMDKVSGLEVENPTAMPWYVVILFTLLCGLLIYQYRTMVYSNRVSSNDISA
jgi:membrane protease YdiL (CAAX protease family)